MLHSSIRPSVHPEHSMPGIDAQLLRAASRVQVWSCLSAVPTPSSSPGTALAVPLGMGQRWSQVA